MQILKGKQSKPRRVLIYGENGIGKSTFGARFPEAIVLNFEDGVGDLDVDKTPLIKSTSEAMECLVAIYSMEYKSVVIDTVDWLEKLLASDVARNAGKDTIEDIGFGRGYQALEHEWMKFIAAFNSLWNAGKNIVFVCHAKVAKFKNPGGDAYNYWSPALYEQGSKCIIDWVDEIGFARQDVLTIVKDEGFNNKRAIGVDSGRRICSWVESASHVAKNRIGITQDIPFSFFEYWKHVEAFRSSGNIDGVVVNGSSKVGV